MKRVLIGSVCALGMTVAMAGGISNPKIGVVDFRQVLQQTAYMKDASAKLKKEFSPRQEKLVKLEKRIQADMKKLNRDRSVMSDKQREKFSKKIANERSDLMKQEQALNTDYLTAQHKVMENVIHKLQGSIQAVAKKDGLNIVLQKNAVPYFNNKLDVTNEVIDSLKS